MVVWIVLPLALGWITTTLPFLIQFQSSESRVVSLDEARDYVDNIVQESRMDSDGATRLKQQIRRAKSVEDMARAVAQAGD